MAPGTQTMAAKHRYIKPPRRVARMAPRLAIKAMPTAACATPVNIAQKVGSPGIHSGIICPVNLSEKKCETANMSEQRPTLTRAKVDHQRG